VANVGRSVQWSDFQSVLDTTDQILARRKDIILATSETRTTTTFATLTGFTFYADPQYPAPYFLAVLFINSPVAADIKYQVSVSGTAAVSYGVVGQGAGITREFSSAGAAVALQMQATDEMHVISGYATNGGSISILSLQVAQNAASGTSTIYSGSFMILYTP
jgi:hypothetical protein